MMYYMNHMHILASFKLRDGSPNMWAARSRGFSDQHEDYFDTKRGNHCVSGDGWMYPYQRSRMGNP